MARDMFTGDIIEQATGDTVHLFDGDQPYDSPRYRALCGRTFASDRCVNGRGEPVCVSCINVENARFVAFRADILAMLADVPAMLHEEKAYGRKAAQS